MAWGFFTSCLSLVKLGLAQGLDLGGKDVNGTVLRWSEPSPACVYATLVCPLSVPLEFSVTTRL